MLGLVTNSSEISLAFEVYDALRRPRRSAIAESSIWAGKIITGRHPEVGLDMEKIREVLPRYQRPIQPFDLEAQQREAVEMFKERKGATK